MQAISPYLFFISPSFNPIFTLFMQISFLPIYKKYFLLTIPLHQQKIHEKTSKSVFLIVVYFHQKINCFIHWKDSCYHPLLTFFILITPLKSTKSKAYKEKNPKKEQKIPDGYANIQLLLLLKNYPLPPLSIIFLSIFILMKCQKAPFYKAFNKKRKRIKKEEEDCSLYIQKDIRKALLYIM